MFDWVLNTSLLKKEDAMHQVVHKIVTLTF